ncbi:sulfite exporter TauE/SafE family protein [Halorubrum sp. DTA98]|uniref:sulfite exporter TauE/SafE family protein n=1 Tax=Halorubrum sp. DTA98 TaxID=3402163 RepID=UPI003AAB0AB3
MFLTFSLGELLFIVVVSFVICTIATSLAMESAAFFVPTFLLLFPAVIPTFPAISPNGAIGLTLIIMFFGQTSTVVGYWFRRQIRFRVAGSVLLISVPFAVVGRVVSYGIPGNWLLLIFAAVVFILSVVVYRAHASDTPNPSTDADGTAPAPRETERSHVFDQASFASGGLIAGLVGFAIGEVANTRLHVNNGLPIRTSIGTSTLILYVTILTANVVNIALLSTGWVGQQNGIAVPWGVAVIIAPVVLVGGQAGAYLNSRLPESMTVRVLVVAYVAIGLVTLARLAL